MTMARILCDMDDTILWWGKKKDEVLRKNHPHLTDFLFGELQTTWDLMAGLDEEHKTAMILEMDRPGFYAGFEPIDGSIQALHDMRAEGHDVWIVSTPWASNPTCMADKNTWLNEHLGWYNSKQRWGSRLILTHDKTLVKGSIIIDDKPVITGEATPEWEHVLFSQPHNASVTDKRRINDWSEWRTILQTVSV
jgi:5'-nucleotidase